MANESNKELTSVWTPANIVTCVRIVFIPVFMIVSALSHTSVAGTDWSTFDGPLAAAAFVLYVILSCTDKVDGYLARSRNEITDFGKFLDPIADKLLVFSALLLFLDFGAVTVWSVFIILFRELLVSALRMVASAAGVVVAADKLGKYKTATTMVSICGYLCVFAMAGLHLGPGGSDAWYLLCVAFPVRRGRCLDCYLGRSVLLELPQDRLFGLGPGRHDGII